MTSQQPAGGHAWERWHWLWHGLLLVAVALPTALVGFDPDLPVGTRLLAVGLAAALLAWYGVLIAPRPELADAERPPPRTLVYLAGMVPLFLALVTLDGRFQFLFYGLIPQLFVLLPRLAAVAGTVVMNLLAFAVPGGAVALRDPDVLLSIVGSTTLSTTIGLFVGAIAEQSAQRQEMIEELERARTDLARSAEQNARLLDETTAALRERTALSEASAAVAAARTPAEVVAALGHHLAADDVDALALLAPGDDGWTVTTTWGEPLPSPLPEAPVARVEPLAGGGGLLVASIRQGRLEPGRAATWRTAASAAGLALENLRLIDDARAAGVLEERRRLARELHDTLAQGLTSVVLQLEAAEEAGEDGGRHMATAKATARATLVEARRAVDALRPGELERASLPEALDRLVARWSADSGVTARADVTGDPVPLHPEVEVTVLRVAQEALANVRRHAGASQVQVTLSYIGDQVALDVRDDGRGFDPARTGPQGFGLTAMRQRAEQVGGSVTVESTPGAGTAVAAAVPAKAAP